MATIAVTCPDGAGPGSQIHVTTSRGYLIEVEVPEDVVPGEVFDITFDEPSESDESEWEEGEEEDGDEAGAEEGSEVSASAADDRAGGLGTAVVQLVSGRGLQSMDPRGLADAYAVLRCGAGGKAQRTEVVEGSLSPVWERATFQFEGVEQHEVLILELFDADPVGRDEEMGQICVPVSNMDGEPQWFPLLPMKGCAEPRGELQLCCAAFRPFKPSRTRTPPDSSILAVDVAAVGGGLRQPEPEPEPAEATGHPAAAAAAAAAAELGAISSCNDTTAKWDDRFAQEGDGWLEHGSGGADDLVQMSPGSAMLAADLGVDRYPAALSQRPEHQSSGRGMWSPEAPPQLEQITTGRGLHAAWTSPYRQYAPIPSAPRQQCHDDGGGGEVISKRLAELAQYDSITKNKELGPPPEPPQSTPRSSSASGGGAAAAAAAARRPPLSARQVMRRLDEDAHFRAERARACVIPAFRPLPIPNSSPPFSVSARTCVASTSDQRELTDRGRPPNLSSQLREAERRSTQLFSQHSSALPCHRPGPAGVAG
jgi:hypothetical protein